jgi:prepilin peptidase CpaA
MQIVAIDPREALALVPLVLLAIGAWRDLATRTIPNWVCVAVALAGIAVRGLDGAGALAWSAGISVLLFLLLVPLHARGVLGGGDVKLAAAAALGLSASGTANFIVATVLAGGVLAALHLALRWLPASRPCAPGSRALRRVLAVERWRIRRHGPLPYGVAIACGAGWLTLARLFG